MVSSFYAKFRLSEGRNLAFFHNVSVLFCLFLFSINLPAQNLIPNPGFDDLNECPENFYELDKAFPWSNASNNLTSALNSCMTANRTSVPNAGIALTSYQPALSGQGYAYIQDYSNISNNGYCGYLQTPLTRELTKGEVYYIEFYMSPDNFVTPSQTIYKDGIGLAFSDTLVNYELSMNNDFIPLTSVVDNFGTLITDTVGWTKASGCYTAKGGESYVVLGDFRNRNNVLIYIEFPNNQPHTNYLYIDDVMVIPFDPLPDTLLLCQNETQTLNASFLDAGYKWNTGETDSLLTVSSAGVYTVEAFLDNCVLRDTVVVLSTEETEALPRDTVICQDEIWQPVLPFPGDYLWSDGSENATLAINASGFYSVSVTNNCGEYVFSVDVEAESCFCEIFVPNAFSPDFDGVNDKLEIYPGCDFEYEITDFRIYDRWGGRVFSMTNENEIGWDGTVNGTLAAEGVYIWFLEYDVIRNGIRKRRVQKGDVSIIP